MNPLHRWNVGVEEAVRLQDNLRDSVILKKTFKEVKTVAGADVAYSGNDNFLFGAIVVCSYPAMEPIDSATAGGAIDFPYLPGLLSFREGPILIKAFQKLNVKPDLMIFEGHGIAHPRRMGLASHLGLWLNLPSIGCAKTPLLNEFELPGPSKRSYRWVYRRGEKVGAVLRTRQGVNPVFVSPGHNIDLLTSIQIIFATSPVYRIPEPLRMAHHLSRQIIESA